MYIQTLPGTACRCSPTCVTADLGGGVIVPISGVGQARIAEDAGAVAVMALERVPADIRAQGGVSRMSDPDMIDQMIAAVPIPVMAKARIGHFVEAQVLQSLGVDYIDESEVLTPADYITHIDVSNATGHMRKIRAKIAMLAALPEDELYVAAKEVQAPYELVKEVAATGKLPVVLFTAGGIATPADAAMMMQLGADGVFVGSGIFKSSNPGERIAALANAVTFHNEPAVIDKISRDGGYVLKNEARFLTNKPAEKQRT
ncbi:pyridoxal 5'-phosphate synthase lyase subunit PdxS [Paenarthrobacter ureafaciens]|nr:pyridoxal 5'-phosphate synthase lyase subunit PdxS [Paenarthrobacter ureafaciens]MCX8453656.1 pyridoxal 5'-phosphate synthase lyase subunit PdxS [Paenarthrobacter ureafaciens]MCY0973315.1 pyridoxal 5'-phosphate synthase lyase subunit PdxS [Paenarthrobacter ureafaciens]